MKKSVWVGVLDGVSVCGCVCMCASMKKNPRKQNFNKKVTLTYRYSLQSKII